MSDTRIKSNNYNISEPQQTKKRPRHNDEHIEITREDTIPEEPTPKRRAYDKSTFFLFDGTLVPKEVKIPKTSGKVVSINGINNFVYNNETVKAHNRFVTKSYSLQFYEYQNGYIAAEAGDAARYVSAIIAYVNFYKIVDCKVQRKNRLIIFTEKLAFNAYFKHYCEQNYLEMPSILPASENSRERYRDIFQVQINTQQKWHLFDMTPIPENAKIFSDRKSKYVNVDGIKRRIYNKITLRVIHRKLEKVKLLAWKLCSNGSVVAYFDPKSGIYFASYINSYMSFYNLLDNKVIYDPARKLLSLSYLHYELFINHYCTLSNCTIPILEPATDNIELRQQRIPTRTVINKNPMDVSSFGVDESIKDIEDMDTVSIHDNPFGIFQQTTSQSKPVNNMDDTYDDNDYNIIGSDLSQKTALTTLSENVFSQDSVSMLPIYDL